MNKLVSEDVTFDLKEKKEENFEDAKKNIENVMEIENKVEKKQKVSFWAENPNVLFQNQYLFEFYPVESMSYEQKLNAITSTVLLLTIFSFILPVSDCLIIFPSG